MQEKVLILDFGSQYTQLIARRIRELFIYCEIHPFNNPPKNISEFKAVVLSGSPFSVRAEDAPHPDLEAIKGKLPLLGVCYGAQYLAHFFGGQVSPSNKREYGRAHLSFVVNEDPFFKGVPQDSQVWMSHADTILNLPENAVCLASTADVENAAYKIKGEQTYAIQFHPEVYHSTDGKQVLENFLVHIAGVKQEWTPDSFVDMTLAELQEKIGKDQVILGLSGGVDSSVAAMLLHKAIGKQLNCIFVNNGLLRKNEFEQVLEQYKGMGLNIKGVDASDQFLDALEGVSDPETKRKIIGKTFIDVFDAEAHLVEGVRWLGQGTIYPDVIESISVNGPSATIKSHHNVGGLPDFMKLDLVEPLRMLFKDEVRRVGKSLGIEASLLGRHPFPGPGLAVRIIGEVKKEYADVLREADNIFIEMLHEKNLYNNISQAFTVFMPIKSVGVTGDGRAYGNVVSLRAVKTIDFMTAKPFDFPFDFLEEVSTKIINEIPSISRVCLDISSKPPATIEWE